MIDLMTPRVVLQIPFPNMHKDHKVGDVFELEFVDSEDLTGTEIKAAVYFKEGSGHGYIKSDVDKCVEVFRPLAWYEKRDIKDMPEYVKCENAKGMYFAGKVMEWDFNNRLAIFSKYDNGKPKEVISFNRETKDFTPATSTEYDNYIKQKI